MKKTLKLMCLFMLALVLSIGAKTNVKAATTENGFEYSVNSDDTITITKYTGDLTNVIVPSEIEGKDVSTIDFDAFKNNKKITSVVIPDTVTYISDEVFAGCENLASITLTNSLTRMGEYVFSRCYNLQSIIIPSSLKRLCEGVFYDCKSLKEIVLPNTLTSINGYLFNGCDNLKKVILPENVTEIRDYLFYNWDGATSYEIPNTVTKIGNNAFEDCDNLASITFHSNIKTIGEHAFYNCIKLNNVVIPEGATSIGEYAFGHCNSLTSITIPASVTNIGKWAFENCNKVTIYGKTGSYAEKYASEYSIPFVDPDKKTTPVIGNTNNNGKLNNSIPAVGTTLKNTTAFFKVTVAGDSVEYSAPINKNAKIISIPSSVLIDGITYKVTSIAPGAFKNNKKLIKITIGSNVKTIGKQAFYGCKNLKSITIKSTKLTMKSVGAKAFTKAGSKNYKKLVVKVPKSKKKAYVKLLKKKGLSSKAKIK